MLEPTGLTFDGLSASEQNWFDEPAIPQKHEQIDAATGQPRGFGTVSGKVEFASSILADLGYDPVPAYVETLPPDHQDGYPFLLMTGATSLVMTHQDHRQVASLRRQHPDPTARIHPMAAAKLGLADGDWVWIESPTGRVRQRLRVTSDVHPRVVDAERWWYPERPGPEPDLFGVFESNVNVLTDDSPDLCDPAHGSWPFRMGRCRVLRATAP